MKSILTLLIVFCSLTFGYSQVTSIASGNWNNPNTWDCACVPDFNSGIITVAQGHSVNVPNGLTISVDDVIVSGAATLTINSGGRLIVLNGAASDDLFIQTESVTIDPETEEEIIVPQGLVLVDANGVLESRGVVASNGNNLLISGEYEHNQNGGTIPNASWLTGSLTEITGYTSGGRPAGISQTFYNFTWNCPSQAGNPALYLSGDPATINVTNDFTVLSTGNASFRMSLTTTTSKTINIGGDLILSNSSRVSISSSSSTVVNVSGDFLSTTSGELRFTTSGNPAVNVTGNFSHSGTGTILFSDGTGIGNLNLPSNFTLSNGLVTETSTGNGNINFIGPGLQNFTGGGTFTNTINFTVNNGSVLNFDTFSISGTGNFTLASGGSIIVGSPDGLVTGTSLGNIRISGTRTYQANGNIIYSGTTQNLGNEWGTTGALNGVSVNLELINGTVVTNNNTGSTSLVGVLTLTNGRFNIGGSNSLTISGAFNSTVNGSIGGTSTSNLTFSGSGTVSTLNFASGAEFLNNLTISRTETISLGSNLTVNGTMTLNSGGNLDFSGRTLTMNGGSIMSAGGSGLISNSTSNLIFGGSTFNSAVPFFGTGNQLNNLTFSTPGGIFNWSFDVTVNTNLTLTAGTLNHTSGLTMAPNSTFIKGGGAITGSSPTAVTSYNVTYTGTGNTGLELPILSTALNNLTVSSSGTVTLVTTGIRINGNATFAGGTFSVGSNSLIMAGSTWASTGGTFSPGTGTVTFAGTTSLSGITNFNNVTVNSTRSVTLSSATIRFAGNIVNNGTINAGTGFTEFNGSTAITGSGNTSFNAVTINAGSSLTAPASPSNPIITIAGDFINDGSFAHNNGSVVFNGSTEIGGVSTTSLYTVTINVGSTLIGPLNGTLNVAGNLSNSGTFDSNGGTLSLNGTVVFQTVTGTYSLNNLNVSNPAGARNSGAITLNGTFALVGSGVFHANGNTDGSGTGTFIVRSTAVNAGGRIAALTTPANFTGNNVTVQRYVNGPDAWRYFSLPTNNGNVGQWKDDFPVTGNFSDPSPAGVNGVISATAPSIYRWDSSNQGWVAVGSGGSTAGTALANNIGYSAYSYPAGDFTIDTNGPIGKNGISINIPRDGFHLVPNPYPSAVDWDLIGRSVTINNQMSIRISNGVFSQWNGSIATNAPFVGWTGEIATGQSFWVESSGAGSITFSENAKTGGQYQFLRESEPINFFRIALTSDKQRDESVIWFTEDATDGIDAQLDARKMKNGHFEPVQTSKHLNISSRIAGSTDDYAINALAPLGECIKQIKLTIEDVEPGDHTISFSELDKLNLNYKLVLIDRYEGVEKKIESGASYSFEVTEDTLSFGRDRFELKVIPEGSVLIDSSIIPTVTINDACFSEGTKVSVTTQTGISYQFIKGTAPVSERVVGTGGSIEMIIQTNALESGTNVLHLEAKSILGCDTHIFGKVFTFENQSVTMPTAANVSVCKASTVTLTAKGAPLGGQYYWFDSETSSNPIAVNTTGLFEIENLLESKTFFVSIANVNGCQGQRQAVTASIVMLNKPVIEQKGINLIVSSSHKTVQWFKDGSPLENEVSSTLIPSAPGNYSVRIIENGCSVDSDVISLSRELFEEVALYPNPVEDKLFVRLPTHSNSAWKSLRIFNSQGQEVFSITDRAMLESNSVLELDLTTLEKGFYILRAIGTRDLTLKVIKR